MSLVSVLLIGTVIAYWRYEVYWISSGERNAALRAVYSIDAIDVQGIQQIEFLHRKDEALRLVGEAHITATTQRDKTLVGLLDSYMGDIDLERDSYNMMQTALTGIQVLNKNDPSRKLAISSLGLAQSSFDEDSQMASKFRSLLMKELE